MMQRMIKGCFKTYKRRWFTAKQSINQIIKNTKLRLGCRIKESLTIMQNEKAQTENTIFYDQKGVSPFLELP